MRLWQAVAVQLLAIVLRDQERKAQLPLKIEEPVVNVTCDCQPLPVSCPETSATFILGIFTGGIIGGTLISGIVFWCLNYGHQWEADSRRSRRRGGGVLS